MSKQVFCPIPCPPLHRDLPVNEFANWYTWSTEFIFFLSEAKAELDKLTSPPLIRLASVKEKYNYTYSWPVDGWSDHLLRKLFVSFARSMPSSSTRIMLFDGLIEPVLSSSQLHSLFAILRGTLAHLCGSEIFAMYAPLGDIGKWAADFPLHADLFAPEYLFNVFDEVSSDNSGASIFLSFPMLRSLLTNVRRLPTETADEILAIMSSNSLEDRFDELYDLLHGSHPWQSELCRAMKQRQLRIKLRSGQGYLLNDRYWLHGREAVHGRVPVSRLHRLVYNVPKPLSGSGYG